MANVPWSLTNPATGNVFMIDDGLGETLGQFSRGSLVGVYNIEKRQIISSVVAHNPGERRTNSRDVSKRIKLTGFVWGNPAKTEDALRANLDTLQQNFSNGIQQLCIDSDGRYWNAELEQFDDGLQDGDVWHTIYTATFYSESAYSYGATVAQTVLTSTPLTGAGGTLYTFGWNAGNANQLGSAPSPLVVTVTLVQSNGTFWVQLTNNSTTPAQSCAVIAPNPPFLDGDVITFDSVNGQATLTRSGVVTKSALPVVPLFLDKLVAAPTSLLVSARANSAPVATIAHSWTGRYR